MTLTGGHTEWARGKWRGETERDAQQPELVFRNLEVRSDHTPRKDLLLNKVHFLYQQNAMYRSKIFKKCSGQPSIH